MFTVFCQTAYMTVKFSESLKILTLKILYSLLRINCLTVLGIKSKCSILVQNGFPPSLFIHAL